ncbi:unnamed protein product [Allacma fusca]|uniref:C2H2-type domain-containing protein n=1 Tax=Allacma fusca TaxID=39272 RepID=A0A8J2PXX9_9HEXA|nr:unnamed protein product [Allacma fusca]
MEAQEFGNINISDLVPNVNLTKHDIERVIEDILDDDYLTSYLPECTDVQLVDENGYEMNIDAFSDVFNQFNSSLYPRGVFPTNLSFQSTNEIPLGARHRYVCSHCCVRFSSKTTLDMHKRISHNENLKSGILPVSLSSESYAVSYILYNRNDLHSNKFGQYLYNIQKLFDRLKQQLYNDISAGLKLCGPIGVRFCLPSVFQKIIDPLLPEETDGTRFHKMVWSNTQIIIMQGNIEATLEKTVATLQDKVMAYFSEESYVLTDVCVFGFQDTGITETSSRFIKNEKNDVVNERLRKSMARCNARDKVITEFSFPLYVSNVSKTWDDFGNSKTSRRFKQISKPIIIDLFLIIQVNEDTSEDQNKIFLSEHYVLCKDIGSLFRHSNRCKSHLCRQCFQRFKNPETLNVHVSRCFGTTMPELMTVKRNGDDMQDLKFSKNLLQ